ncbi:choice-of-anchor Q domain-containing protein [Flavobacterium sp. B17]|uniref:choice-of-anchor Q domain-containing protein n=1 Tax=Flavobacterium sp. B17 TaxID=95618 RepID=UPI00034887B9|nr:choice-of-anchor Q domain-containing protein [Flavobacterium sp. B17]
MKVLSGATLNINGTLANNVILRGDRNDPAYDTIPKNWNSIKMEAGSALNMNYARLFGGTKGLEMKQTNATINNSFIHTFQEYGIYAIGSTITAKNLVMNNCGESAIGIFRGGTYNLTHCTIANYSDLLQSYNRNGIFATNEWKNESNQTEQGALILNVRNSIVYSDRDNSVFFEQTPGQLFNFVFENCLLKYSSQSEAGFLDTAPSVIQLVKNQNPLFVNYFTAQMNLRVKQNSPAIGKGSTAVAATVPTDIAGVSRTSNPTLGAYQYQ